MEANQGETHRHRRAGRVLPPEVGGIVACGACDRLDGSEVLCRLRGAAVLKIEIVGGQGLGLRGIVDTRQQCVVHRQYL